MNSTDIKTNESANLERSEIIKFIVVVLVLVVPVLAWWIFQIKDYEDAKAQGRILVRLDYTGRVQVNKVFVVTNEQRSNSVIIDGPGSGRTCESTRPLGNEGATVVAFIHGLDYLVCE